MYNSEDDPRKHLEVQRGPQGSSDTLVWDGDWLCHGYILIVNGQS